MAFLTMNPIVIAAVVAVYVVLFVLFKKNKVRFQDYLERCALGAKADTPAATA